MSDKLSPLCGGGRRDQVPCGEGGGEALRAWENRQSVQLSWHLGLSPSGVGTVGLRWPCPSHSVAFLQQHHSLAVSAGRVDSLMNLGFRVLEKIKQKEDEVFESQLSTPPRT